MTNVSSVPSNSALAQLLAIQAKASQTTGSLSTQTSASQPPASTDSLSISAAALQALQGLGLDPTQTQQAQTYTAHGHHHHHHSGTKGPVLGSASQNSSNDPSAQIPQVAQTGSAPFQSKA
jgi:hypothetical protein